MISSSTSRVTVHSRTNPGSQCLCECIFPSTTTVSRMLTRYVILLSTFSMLARCPHTARHFSLRSNFEYEGSNHLSNQSKTPSPGSYYDSMPSSFAILINLGLDGQFRNMYSSHSHSDLCDSQQMWDPFSKQCRQLYCKDHYEIKDLRCVSGKNNSSDDKIKPSIKFLDSKSKFVNITLGFSPVKLPEELSEQWIASNQMEIITQFSQQFSSSWSIDTNRIINVTAQFALSPTPNLSPYPWMMSINFLIMDSNDVQNDEIVSMLSEHVANIKNLPEQYFFLGRPFNASHIHTTLAEINDFCLKETDMPIWYWNSDFTILSKDNLTMIYVNKTGRLYYPGEYMGSVLCVEHIDSQGRIRLNVSSNSVVCEKTLIDDSCPRILLNHSEYEFIDGRRLYSTNGHYFDKYELTENQSVFVCIPSTKMAMDHVPLDIRIESILSTSLMIVSITLLTLVLVTFVRIRTLRSTINGFNSINLVVCLEVMQITFLLNQFIHQCRISAVMFHFFILATISWSSVIAYDMHRVFVTGTLIARPNSNKIRLTYGTVAYFLPAFIVTVANLGDIFDLAAIKGDYGPVLPSNVCWMRKREATIIYFIVPVTLTVLCNFVLYLRIIFNIRNEIKSFSSLKKVTRIPSSSSSSSTISVISSSESSESKLAFNQTSIYTRLSVPLGFTWIIALFSTIVPPEYKVVIRIMSYLFIIANTSQGVTLFLAFGVYKKIFSAK